MEETELNNMKRQWRLKAAAGSCVTVVGILMSPWAGATDGYFAHGYGMKSIGMGGASVARTDDAFGGANNPAQMVFVGGRLDLGLNMFDPTRGAERAGASIPPLNGNVDSESKQFWVPEFGYNALIRPDLSLGVSVYGNGGMNTDYPQGNFQCPNRSFQFYSANMLCGVGRLGVDLEQLVVAPVVAYKLTADHAIGLAPLITYQRFKLEGAQAFAPLSSDPNSLTNNGYDNSRGIGVRVGYLGRFSQFVSVGAQYATKTAMSKFSKYKGLFADQGAFDLPSHFSAGVMLHPTSAWNVALDYERILYSGVSSVGNPSTNQAPLGASGGPGFGWQDVNVYKLGVEYAVNPALIVRAGYNRSDNPIQPRDVTFNILAPGVVTNHYTIGATHPFGASYEVTAAFMYAPTNTVTGSSLFNALFPLPNAGGTETIRLGEKSFGLAWSKKL
jgi:long-chain fatty acid transport protein